MTYLPPRPPITAGPRPARTASGWRRWPRWALLVSLLLHLLPVLALLLLMPTRRLPEPLPDPGFAVVFEGGTGEETQSTETGPLPTPQAPVPEAAPEPPVQQAEPEPPPEPPVQQAEPEPQPEPPVQQAEPEPQPEPPVQQAQPEPQPPEPPQPEQEPETAQQEPPPEPQQQQAQPAPRVSPFPAPEEESPDAPPFAGEPFRVPEAPPPLPRPRSPYAGVPVLPSNPFAAPRAAPATPRPPRRGLDLALGPVMPAPRVGGGQGAPDSTMSVRGAENLGADWRALFRAWLERHSRYPQEAAMMGQDGPVTVRFTMDRYGKVKAVELIHRSGSMYLNAATVGLLRGQTLPPFLPGTPQDEAEIDLTINYILIRR